MRFPGSRARSGNGSRGPAWIGALAELSVGVAAVVGLGLVTLPGASASDPAQPGSVCAAAEPRLRHVFRAARSRRGRVTCGGDPSVHTSRALPRSARRRLRILDVDHGRKRSDDRDRRRVRRSDRRKRPQRVQPAVRAAAVRRHEPVLQQGEPDRWNLVPAVNASWALEISLDIEWVHAAAPGREDPARRGDRQQLDQSLRGRGLCVCPRRVRVEQLGHPRVAG